jgi:formate/nitrite transporter FocA (FNT family)
MFSNPLNIILWSLPVDHTHGFKHIIHNMFAVPKEHKNKGPVTIDNTNFALVPIFLEQELKIELSFKRVPDV